MLSVKQLDRLTVEEYLDAEERGAVRHEYVEGVIYAMVGASARHNLIAGALFSTLRSHLRGKPCHAFMSDMKVRVGNVFYYPDVMVTCGPIDPAARYQTNPVLPIEVLSESTEAKDRLEKLVAYRSLPTLTETVLVAQDKIQLEIFRRTGDTWEVETCSYGDTARLASVELGFPVETIYEDVMGSIEFEESQNSQ